MKEEHETHNYNGVFHSNAAELYLWAKTIVSFLCTRGGKKNNEEEEEEVEDEEGEKEKGGG